MNNNNDLISRADVVSTIIKWASGEGGDIVEQIESLPSASVEVVEWIPCSERLPEADGEYLCDYNGHIHIGQMINRHFRHYGEIADHLITAWMPLPKPYEGSESDEVD